VGAKLLKPGDLIEFRMKGNDRNEWRQAVIESKVKSGRYLVKIGNCPFVIGYKEFEIRKVENGQGSTDSKKTVKDT
jgi:hypothetical protein